MITNKIKEYRKNKKMTQGELAIELGVSRKTLSIIESGRVIPKIDTAYKLSLILDATVEELF
ncbi:MAG: helix-turn-helix domain-containing protein [Bacilli bacterium]|nr:helix-turn-helix domain-containing protein [Bacilli bacterium]